MSKSPGEIRGFFIDFSYGIIDLGILMKKLSKNLFWLLLFVRFCFIIGINYGWKAV